MSFLQLRVNCADNSAPFYRLVAAPLQATLARQGYLRWTLSRGWQHGPHYLLTFDTGAANLPSGWLDEAQALVSEFLAMHPSTAVDPVRYRALQARLNDIEAAGIDPDIVAPNDTLSVHPTDAARLAAKYESTSQWQSVFDTETRLRELVIDRWLDAERHDRFVAQMMVLLACVYPPVPSDDPARPEYDGFLSFHSNFVFWRHALPPHQRVQVDARFDTDYAAMLDEYVGWLAELPDAVTGQTALGRTAQFMMERFAAFLALAGRDVIHARSPFARQQTAQRSSVSDFHKEFFYNADGSAYQFSQDFCAYRWLLNIVYKTLPLLNIAPLRRQQFNQALDRLHLAYPANIAAIRAALPAAQV
ncbi:hypothetical protein ACFFTM_20030 [Pseudoduganella plicata]|uniref:Uncharacterized protein n=1 Tax=Pseudoduganella plicata TaxID=321984 RepID=A0A4V1ATX2_9BURK|nr:hypothetical protein [Pseudoduganella plicata]QBQ37158.1 hypothetical protein E1742_13980 [Pseudoduganella plicata]GGY98863.1 hypothetical protein GCM10007388_35610 [Pseudoduganella plicata]